MPRLNWDQSGQRYYETGVDRGVLYVDAAPGVPWTGLIAVSENVSGGDPRPFYVDGVKYLNLASAEEFEASVTAFSSPAEFGPCDGTVSIQNGLLVTQQPRKSFSMSYRTKLGNDTEGIDHAYKIHFVYNALAAPSSRPNNSINDSPDPIGFSWAISTLPPTITGFKPTAHMIVDTRFTAPFTLKLFEDLIYGSDSITPRLPQPNELVMFFSVPSVKAVLVSANTYEIHEVDPADARATMQPFPPAAPAIGEDPILWFDTSNSGYAIPKIVTGD